MKRLIYSLLTLLMVGIVLVACNKLDSDVAPQDGGTDVEKSKTGVLDTPTLSCEGSTQTSISIRVTAGRSGAPAGFSLQWMLKEDWEANGDSWNGDKKPCEGSFSGNANISNYNLLAGQSVTIRVGDILLDNGASIGGPDGCDGILECGTEYVFRVFAHATSTQNRSAFSGPTYCSTLSCDPRGNECTYTQGFWKNNGPVPTGQGNSYLWPQSVKDNGLMLGSVSYTPDQLLAILNQQVAGNGLVNLAHQLIAAKLNIAKFTDPNATPDVIVSAIRDADDAIGSLIVPPVGTGFISPGSVSRLVDLLADFNEGGVGMPGHCTTR